MSKAKDEVIRFSAGIHSIKTTIDGGANVTFALNGKEVTALTQLLEIRQQTGVILEVAAVPVKAEVQNAQKETTDNNTRTKRKQRYPYRT